VAVALGRLNAGHDLRALLERCGHQISDTHRIPRTQLSTLISRRILDARMSRRTLLAAGTVGALGLGALAAWFWPRWSVASALLPNPRKARWLQQRDSDQFEVIADGGFTLTAGDKPALLRLAKLAAGNYRVSTTITLEPETTRAGVYFDFAEDNGPASHESAQSIEFSVNALKKYGLTWRQIPYHPDGSNEMPGPPFGEFMAGQPLTLEIEWSPAGVTAAWCNQEPVPAEIFRSTAFRPQGTVGLILAGGTAHFTPVMVRQRN
jgi:hypothetical protein